ncbi:MAG: sodium/glutamate symporter [Candidatus Ancaeobacter aquaticus]|nr:sodium/glutamate symporter [Candidatus Ancaeobacter aquaticus]
MCYYTFMTIVISFACLCLLLALGKFLRVKVGLFQRLFLPASVIGGILGLILLHTVKNYIPASCTAGWSFLPGFLINIVFATLFLGVTLPSVRYIWKEAGPQLVYGQIVAWGQYAVALFISIAVLAPLFLVPKYFGVIVPVGFEGGHGTAAGLKPTFDLLKWTVGDDYCLAAATFGITTAIIIGIILINWAVRKKYVCGTKELNESEKKGIYNIDERPIAGRQTTTPSSMDSLALHIAIVGIAIFVGFVLKVGLVLIGSLFLTPIQNEFFKAFPLFPLCMMGGIIVQIFISKIIKIDIIDHGLMERISSTALDFLVVAAISIISLPLIMKGLIPLILVVVAGIGWNLFCILVLAKRMLPDAWFERGIVEMGQSMGVTATGLLLLRIVDPEHKTPAYTAFGCKQLLHEPFMGGGLWTSIAIPLAIIHGSYLVLAISIVALIVWFVLWSVLFRKQLRGQNI